MYKKILHIQSLKLPDEINNLIYINYKYSMLETSYQKKYREVIDYLNHYIFLNKKINKKNHKEFSLLNTIKYFD